IGATTTSTSIAMLTSIATSTSTTGSTIRIIAEAWLITIQMCSSGSATIRSETAARRGSISVVVPAIKSCNQAPAATGRTSEAATRGILVVAVIGRMLVAAEAIGRTLVAAAIDRMLVVAAIDRMLVVAAIKRILVVAAVGRIQAAATGPVVAGLDPGGKV